MDRPGHCKEGSRLWLPVWRVKKIKMKVQFLKDHSHQSATWKKGQVGNIIGAKAREWEKKKIVKILDRAPAQKPTRLKQDSDKEE